MQKHFKHLKLVTQGELHDTWETSEASESAKTGLGVEIEVDTLVADGIDAAIKVDRVCQIERFPAELDLAALCKCEALLNTTV